MDFLLRCDFDINKIPLALSKFHSQILHFWKMIFTHNFTPHSSVLWNNRTILINRKSVFKAEWFDKGILFVTDLMDCKGVLLDYTSFVERSNINCTHREYQKICKAIPVALIHLIQNTLTYSDVTPILPNLSIGHHKLVDKNFNNKVATDAFKSKLYHDYNKNNVPVNLSDMLGKAFSKYVKWPIPPKVKETHFKICHKIYPVSNFLHKRFKFDKAGCAFCDFTDESLEHLFFTCSSSCSSGETLAPALNISWTNLNYSTPHWDYLKIVVPRKYHRTCPSFLCFNYYNFLKFFCLTCFVDPLKVWCWMLLYLVLYYAVTSMSYCILFGLIKKNLIKKKKKKLQFLFSMYPSMHWAPTWSITSQFPGIWMLEYKPE